MAERKFTLIEYHNHAGGGFQLAPDLRSLSPFSGGDEEETAEEGMMEEEGEVESEGGGNGLQLLVALVLIVGIALAVKRLRGNGGEDFEYETEDIEVTEYES